MGRVWLGILPRLSLEQSGEFHECVCGVCVCVCVCVYVCTCTRGHTQNRTEQKTKKPQKLTNQKDTFYLDALKASQLCCVPNCPTFVPQSNRTDVIRGPGAFSVTTCTGSKNTFP
jgi:hypothetical protein